MPKAPHISGIKLLWICGLFSVLGLLGVVWSQIPKVYIAKPRNWGNHQLEWMPYYVEGKFGYIDSEGHRKIAPRFDGADGFCEGLARVLLNGRFGFIDSSGNMVIPARFAWASPFRGGYASVWTGSDWGYLDKNGRPMVIFPKQGKNPQTHSL